MMAALYDVSVPAINQHLKRIFGDNELEESSVVTDRTTACTTQNNEVEPQRTQRTQRNAPFLRSLSSLWLNNVFHVTVTRKPVEELDLVDEDASKTTNAPINSDLSGQPDPINDLLNLIRETPNADYVSLAHSLQVSEASVKRYIQKLKQQNRLRRVGSKKTGHWEIIEHSSRISTN